MSTTTYARLKWEVKTYDSSNESMVQGKFIFYFPDRVKRLFAYFPGSVMKVFQFTHESTHLNSILYDPVRNIAFGHFQQERTKRACQPKLEFCLEWDGLAVLRIHVYENQWDRSFRFEWLTLDALYFSIIKFWAYHFYVNLFA